MRYTDIQNKKAGIGDYLSDLGDSLTYGFKTDFPGAWGRGLWEGLQDSASRTAYNFESIPWGLANFPAYLAWLGGGIYNKATDQDFNADNAVSRNAIKAIELVNSTNPAYGHWNVPKYVTNRDLIVTDLFDIPGAALLLSGAGGLLTAAKAAHGGMSASQAMQLGLNTAKAAYPSSLLRYSPWLAVDATTQYMQANDYKKYGFTPEQIKSILAGDEVGIPELNEDVKFLRAAGRSDDQIANILSGTEQYEISEEDLQKALQSGQYTPESINAYLESIGALPEQVDQQQQPPQTTSTKAKEKTNYTPYIAAGLTGAAGVAGSHLLTNKIKWFRRHRLLKHLVDLAAGGALGYAAWKLSNKNNQ